MSDHKHWSETELEELRKKIDGGIERHLHNAFQAYVAYALPRVKRGEQMAATDVTIAFLIAGLVNERFEYQKTGEMMCDDCLFTLVSELRKQVWEKCPLPSPHPTV